MHYFNFQLLSVNNSIQEGVSKVHLNFTFKWWDSLICDCICQKNMIKKLAWDHVFEFKTLSFYRAFARTFRALFAFFAFRANFAFCQSRLRHRAFFLPFMPALILPFMPALFLPFMPALFLPFMPELFLPFMPALFLPCLPCTVLWSRARQFQHCLNHLQVEFSTWTQDTCLSAF